MTSDITYPEILLQKIVDLENEIIEKDKIITKNHEEMDLLQETFKNMVIQVSQVLEALKWETQKKS